MTKALATPSRIFGECPAGYKKSDKLVIDEIKIHAIEGPTCYVVMSAFTDQVTQIEKHERVTSHLSCPGCSFNSDKDNRVVFVLSSEDAFSLSKKFSMYNWERIDGRETEKSKYYCDLCWKLTQEGKYTEAEKAIDKAIRHLKPINK